MPGPASTPRRAHVGIYRKPFHKNSIPSCDEKGKVKWVFIGCIVTETSYKSNSLD